MPPLTFHVNGRRVTASGVSPTATLLEYLRRDLGLVGAKEGCAEGDCGACTVVLLDPEGPRGACFRAINSCLVLLPMVQGRQLWTVEGIGSSEAPHAVQESMLRQGAAQCGYCTPGFVMSLFEGFYRQDGPEGAIRDEQVSGNLCRCTGYRPIREVARELVGTRPDDRFLRLLERSEAGATTTDVTVGEQRFVAPGSLESLCDLLEASPEARIVAGATDLALEVTKEHRQLPLVVSLQALSELRGLEWQGDTLRIGATVPLSDLEEETAGSLPVIARMLRYFGSRQIKHRATLGGNLCNASPVGDLAPVLLALGARVELAARNGRRTVSLDDFFLAYRKTTLQPGEVLTAVLVDRPEAGTRLGAYKVSRRRELDIATVSACFAVRVADDRKLVAARLAFGGMAPVPARALLTEQLLLEGRWEREAVEAAARRLEEDFTPIDDHRGSAWYRRTLARNLLVGFFDETRDGAFRPLPERPVATLLAEEER